MFLFFLYNYSICFSYDSYSLLGSDYLFGELLLGDTDYPNLEGFSLICDLYI
jgi:hypothetical protein